MNPSSPPPPPQLDGDNGSDHALLTASITSFLDRFNDNQCCIVTPTNTLRNHAQVDAKIAASDLLLYDEKKSKKDVQWYHFTKVTLASVFPNTDKHVAALKLRISALLMRLLSHVVDTKRRTLIPTIICKM